MSAQIILCPRGRLYDTAKSLQARGYALSNVRGRYRSLLVAHRVPVLREVVPFRFFRSKP